ncbi:MAG: DUF4215 domain-containing protein [bacterium]
MDEQLVLKQRISYNETTTMKEDFARAPGASPATQTAAVLAVFLLATSGCLGGGTRVCASGLVCPEELVCDDVHDRCVRAEQLTACEGVPNDDPCVYSGIDGWCRQGLCMAEACGNGIAEGLEECDGDDLLGLTCDLPFSGGILACTDSCKLDYRGCTGEAVCGDALIEGDEQCDGTSLPVQTCFDFGFEYGALGCTDSCTLDQTDCGWHGWRHVDTGAGGDVQYDDVWGSSPSDVFAVGFQNPGDVVISHFDGESWTNFTTPPTEILEDLTLWGSGSTDVYMAGAGMVLHFDGTLWNEVAIGSGMGSFSGVGGTGTNDVWVTGFDGTGGVLYQYDGTDWTEHPSSVGLWGIWVVDASTRYLIGGDSSTNLSLHDAAGFHPVQLPGLYGAKDVWASSVDDVYVVASASDATGGDVVLHFDGAQWREESGVSRNIGTALGTVSGSGPEDIYVTTAGGRRNVWHYDGHNWLLMETGANASLARVWVAPNGTAFAAGGVVMRYHGAAWSILPELAFGGQLHTVRGSSPNDVYALSQSALFHYDGQAWSQVQNLPCSELVAAWVYSADDVYFGCSGEIWHFDGTTYFLEFPVGIDPFVFWGFTPNVLFVATATGYVDWRDEAMFWASTQAATVPLWGLHGSGSTHVIAVGDQGTAVHFDGSMWTERNVGSVNSLRAVWCGSYTSCWAVGDGGLIAHHDGQQWSVSQPVTNENLHAVWGLSTGGVFAAGENGTLLHYDGQRWTPFNAGTSLAIRSLFSTGGSDLFLAGDGSFTRLLLKTGDLE